MPRTKKKDQQVIAKRKRARKVGEPAFKVQDTTRGLLVLNLSHVRIS